MKTNVDQLLIIFNDGEVYASSLLSSSLKVLSKESNL